MCLFVAALSLEERVRVRAHVMKNVPFTKTLSLGGEGKGEGDIG